MENYKLVSSKELDKNIYKENIIQVFDPKRLKTKRDDFNGISSNRVMEKVAVKDAEAVEEVATALPEVEEPIVSNIEIPEFESSVYGSHVEEEVAPDTIKEITNNLEKSYKGTSHSTTKIIEEAVIEEKPKEAFSKEDFENELNASSYSDKIRIYKDGVREQYNNHNKKIALKQGEIDGLKFEYSNEAAKSSKLQEEKKNLKRVCDGINAMDLGFLPNEEERDDLENEVVIALSKLFEDRRLKHGELSQELDNTNDKMKNLSENERNSRDDLKKLELDLSIFINEHYPLIKDANKKDAELRELSGEITEFTGIKDEPKLDKNKVFSIENLMEKKNSIPANPFNDLREVEEQSFRRAI